ncbi:MAG TPA: DnaB-like helicase C-terminal domain-containing protein [Bryobacteraceae bacterium]|nr:DnaB-like helicase C-terminal domain-containing protein [Bryobacteraceae bacterium]
MTEFTFSEISAYYQSRCPNMAQPDKREWRGPCPVHNGKGPNFSVQAETGLAHCHSQCKTGWDVIGLEMAISGCDFPTAKAAVFSIIGRSAPTREDADVEACYNYVDEAGKLRYQVVRKYGKKFVQRQPEPAGGWIWNLKGTSPVPYRLPEMIAANFVAVVEGEKDANNLHRIGIPATCNNGGAGKFSPGLVKWFTGKHVAVLPDFDSPGREHALKVAEMLSAVAASVKIIELPGLAPKGDVSDWLAAGGTVDQLRDLFRKAPLFSDTFEFLTPLPQGPANTGAEKYIHTFQGEVDLAGGVDQFWNLPAQEGIPTPYPRLTCKLGGGMRNGELYVIGGNQGSGKTSLALQFALAVLRRKLGVLYFSMEMSARDVFQRMAAIEARVDLLEFRELQRAATVYSIDLPEMKKRLVQQSGELSRLPLLVSTKSSVTPEHIANECRRLKQKSRLDLIVVDHMQLMAATGSVRGDYEKFTTISRTMKQIAVELGLPVLLVSQTSRNNTTDRRSELEVSDLRGSGAIEEDAAACMLIYEDKDDRERAKQARTYASGPVKTWLKLGKNRYGLQGLYLPLFHAKKYTRFDVATDETEHGEPADEAPVTAARGRSG